MLSLEDLQRSFYHAIFQKKSTDLGFIKSSDPSERLAIYSHTIFENIRKSLQLTFPGIWALLGDACANKAAYHFCFIEQHLPSTGCLDDFGEYFPEFLNQIEALNTHPYLQDYALYEWLKHKAYSIKKTRTIHFSELHSIPENLLNQITFIFSPCFFTFSSLFPIKSIEALIKNPNASPVNLTNLDPCHYAIISRVKNKQVTIWISLSLWDFIHSLKSGKSLYQSALYTQEIHPDFDLPTALTFLIQNHFIYKIK